MNKIKDMSRCPICDKKFRDISRWGVSYNFDGYEEAMCSECYDWAYDTKMKYGLYDYGSPVYFLGTKS